MAAGITAKILHVDLTTRQTRSEELPETAVRKYLGGGALACHLLLRDMPAGVDPLGPDNVLVFTTSVVNGLSLSGTNRYTAAAKSPLTGGYGESEAGGWWGPELRAAGWDGITVRGRAATLPLRRRVAAPGHAGSSHALASPRRRLPPASLLRVPRGAGAVKRC